jgi:hypothetical protein
MSIGGVILVAFVFLPTGAVSAASIVAIFDREFWKMKHRMVLFFILLSNWVAFLGSVYALFFDWNFLKIDLLAYATQIALVWTLVWLLARDEGLNPRDAPLVRALPKMLLFGADEAVTKARAALNTTYPANQNRLKTWKRLVLDEQSRTSDTTIYFLFMGTAGVLIGIWFHLAMSGFRFGLSTFEMVIALCGLPVIYALIAIASVRYRPRLSPKDFNALEALLAFAGPIITIAILLGLIEAFFSLPLPQITHPSLRVLFGVAGLAMVTIFASDGAKKLREKRDKLLTDDRPPILFLRSFAGEAKESRWRLGYLRGSRLSGRGHDPKIAGLISNPWYRLEQYLDRSGDLRIEQAKIADAMSSMGPYIAIARPGEAPAWTDTGAMRVEAEQNEWQQVVSELIEVSAGILIELGHSIGLSWEIDEVIKRDRPTKVLLILPKTKDSYDLFRNSLGHKFPKGLPAKGPPSQFIVFDDDWAATVLPHRLSETDSSPLAFYLRRIK